MKVVKICEGLCVWSTLGVIPARRVIELLGRVGIDRKIRVLAFIICDGLRDKLRRLVKNGIHYLAEHGFVTRELIVFPEHLGSEAELTAGCGRAHLVRCDSDTDGKACVSALVIEGCSRELDRGISSRLLNIRIDEVHVSAEALGEVGGEGVPVVHLLVDVVPISYTPGGVVISVPSALKVSRERSLTRGRYQEISAVLIVEHLKVRAVTLVVLVSP